MNLQERKELLLPLGQFILTEDDQWQQAKEKAFRENGWFIPEFIDLAANNIAKEYLSKEALEILINKYNIPQQNPSPKKVGIVMAGNIPLVGFHDLLCTFFSGHSAIIKLSSKDEVLLTFLLKKLVEWNSEVSKYITISERLKGCDAYIATGSNNTAKTFEYYFRDQPHIIRRNKTSVAILGGNETTEELEKLADDVHQFFGLGCRNVTKIYVPNNYNFQLLLEVFKKYNYLVDISKYKNNYDYNLAILLLNKNYYMTNGSILLVEEKSLFSPITQLNYEFYTDENKLKHDLKNLEEIQCVLGNRHLPLGKAQQPKVCDYADGKDTMQFLQQLGKEVRKS